MFAPPLSIATPYSPDNCHDEFGWLWMRWHKDEAPDWHLVSTHLPDGIDAEPVIVFHSASGEEHVDVDAADTWAGSPYLPLSAPPCSAQAGAMVIVRLPNGASISFTHEDRDEGAKAMTEAAMAAMRGSSLPEDEVEF